MQGDVQNSVLLFPILHKRERFLTHKVVEENFQELCSFSVGKQVYRRTVVCLKSRLISAFNAGHCQDEAVRQVAVRLCREQGLPVDFLSHCVRQPHPAGRTMQAQAAPRPARQRQRRPDMQVYVPRGRRAEALQSAVASEQAEAVASRGTAEIRGAATRTAVTHSEASESADIRPSGASSDQSEVVFSVQLGPAADVNGVSNDLECSSMEIDTNCDMLSTSANSENSDGAIQACLSLSQESVSVCDYGTALEIPPEAPLLLSTDVADSGGPEEVNDLLPKLQAGPSLQVDPSAANSCESIKSASPEGPQPAIPVALMQSDSVHTNPEGGGGSQVKNDESEATWDSLFDETGECVDPTALKDITKALGEIKVHEAQLDYTKFEPRMPDLTASEYGHILELYNFPAEFETKDLVSALSSSRDQFNIKWVDDTHALAVFSTPFAATEALGLQTPLVRMRPVAEASKQSKMKVKTCGEFLMPYKPRPQTSVSVARRMVSGALGMRMKVDDEQRKKELAMLRDAKGKRRSAAKQRADAWNGDVS